ncbi:hypothetical protein [Sorangium sp. So ce388]|uniref:hypothetical protein n=1 Tax=Sorangium sp. So ce388 TaxID=3133309 RepID=UPI003F5B1502
MSSGELARMRELAISEGQRLARRMFAKRGNRAEMHLDEATLAAMLAVAFERGYETRDEQSKEDT